VRTGIAVDGLAKSYGELQALAPLTLRAQAGEVLAVLGPNGAGKTTLLSLLAGAQRPSAGSIDRTPREVGWAPQQPAVYSRLTVAENLTLFAHLEHVPDVEGAVDSMLEQTGLRERAAEQTGRLSGGNRQRVNVAIALIGDPPVLALDEPSASLDPAQRERLWSFLTGLAAEGRTVIFSTHDPGEAQRRADRLLVLDGGLTAFDGPPAELLAAGGGRDLEESLVRFLAVREGERA